jgi:hypothetical protein
VAASAAAAAEAEVASNTVNNTLDLAALFGSLGETPGYKQGVLLERCRVLEVGVVTHSRGCQIGYMCDQNSTYGLRSLPGGVRLVTWGPRWPSSSCTVL